MISMISFSTKRKKYALKGVRIMQKNRIRTCNFSMRLSELDAAVLDAKKDEYNMSRSEYLRNLILFAPTCERPRYSSDYVDALVRDIDRVGRQLNEVAHNVNSRKTITEADVKILTEQFIELLAVYDTYIRDKVDSV